MDRIMTVNETEYQVVRLLGKGKGGYSYLVTRDGKRYTLKQIHHEPCDYYTFGDKLASELRDYHRLRAIGIPMPEMLQVDEARERILKEFVDGPSIYELVRDDRMKPEYFDQMESMCSLLYPAGINIDYFPTNFIVQDACSTSTMNATIICPNGIFTTGALHTGAKRKPFVNMYEAVNNNFTWNHPDVMV